MGTPRRYPPAGSTRTPSKPSTPLRLTRAALLVGVLGALGLLSTPVVRAADDDPKALYTRMACAECHGADGRTPRWDTTPIIAGQQARYTYLVLKAYQTGEHAGLASAQHAEVNDLLSDAQMRLLADYVAALK